MTFVCFPKIFSPYWRAERLMFGEQWIVGWGLGGGGTSLSGSNLNPNLKAFPFSVLAQSTCDGRGVSVCFSHLKGSTFKVYVKLKRWYNLAKLDFISPKVTYMLKRMCNNFKFKSKLIVFSTLRTGNWLK